MRRPTLRSGALRRKLRWAIAGRDAGKLAALREQLASRCASVHLPEIVVADSGDVAAIEAMAASTRVLISTAGPFALYGDAIVDACVHQRTHYADITGETTWVRRVIDRHHARAERDGTRIVPFCGFDSVPSDLGTLLVVRHIEQTFGAPCVEVKGYFRMMGGFNGGTLATNAHRYETGEVQGRTRSVPAEPARAGIRPRICCATRTRAARATTRRRHVGRPFIMGPINTRVVRRSAALMRPTARRTAPASATRSTRSSARRSAAAKATALAVACADSIV